MATISRRTRKDGTQAYTAQIRIVRGGRLVFTGAQTFKSEKVARAWIKKKEAELARPGGLDAIKTPHGPLADVIDRYVTESRKAIGRTKAQVLNSIKSHPIAGKDCADISSEDIVAFARALGHDRLPQTVQNYLSHLAAVFTVAKPAWGYPLDPTAMQAAMEVCKRLGLTSKSAQRERRPTLAELDALMAHFEDRTKRRRAIPMHKITAFAIFSTRRQEEITRILWSDLEDGRVLVRDMKNPGEKIGNNVWCDLLPEAERIVRSMPRDAVEIFPVNPDTVSTAFTRACALLGIDDLHFHDLRHEGVTRLFEMGRTIPLAASVSGHRSWQSLQRYSHVRKIGDKYAGWAWLDRVVGNEQEKARAEPDEFPQE